MYNKNELISVIIPIYNVEKYLSRCIDSVLNQTYKELEIILIDDGTKDNSGKLAEEYSQKDKRVKVIHKDNEGLGLTRNVGIENSNGKYIAFVDSDDYIEIDMYEKMYNNIKEYNLDACVCDFKRLNKNNSLINNCARTKDKIYNKNEIINEILPSICGSKKFGILIGSAWSVLYKKEIIENSNIRFLNERDYVSEDLIFNLNYFSKCDKIKLLAEDFYVYCENIESLTKTYNPSKIKKFVNLYNVMKKQIQYNFEECYFGLDTLYIENMRVSIIQEVRNNQDRNNVRKNIKKICNDKLLCDILSRYNFKYLTVKQRIFTILVKYKMVFLLKIISKSRKA